MNLKIKKILALFIFSTIINSNIYAMEPLKRNCSNTVNYPWISVPIYPIGNGEVGWEIADKPKILKENGKNFGRINLERKNNQICYLILLLMLHKNKKSIKLYWPSTHHIKTHDLVKPNILFSSIRDSSGKKLLHIFYGNSPKCKLSMNKIFAFNDKLINTLEKLKCNFETHTYNCRRTENSFTNIDSCIFTYAQKTYTHNYTTIQEIGSTIYNLLAQKILENPKNKIIEFKINEIADKF